MAIGSAYATLNRLSVFARTAVGFTVAVCAMSIVGRLFAIQTLVSVVPGWSAISVPTIVCLLLLCVAVMSFASGARVWHVPGVARGAAFLVLATAVYGLAAWRLPGLFPFADPATLKQGYIFGRNLGSFSPATAFCALLAASALLLRQGGTQGWISSSLVLVGLFVIAVDLLGYATSVAALYAVPLFADMSIMTALGLGALFVAICSARPNDGWFAPLAADDSGGVAARRLLPFMVFVPIAIASAVAEGIRFDLFGWEVGIAIIAVSAATVLASATYFVSLWLSGRDRALADEIARRREAEQSITVKLNRMTLLYQITVAVAERQDLRSIFQVLVRRLEDDLPVDFACVHMLEAGEDGLTVTHMRRTADGSDAAAGPVRNRRIDLTPEDIALYVASGDLVREPDLAHASSPLARRLADAGLGTLVAAPLVINGEATGALLIARREPDSISDRDSEFLQQLAAHVGLAAQHIRLHQSLRQAYDDLRQTQESVLQQERLRALGQMASGIAHDINNAISPIGIYTQSLLETETDAPPKLRSYLEMVSRVTKDVGSTVARIRDFYRLRDVDRVPAPLDVNALVRHVVDLTRARWHDMAQQRGVVVTVLTELDPELPQLLADGGDIADALTNLVLNGVDAMPEGGDLTIRTRALDGEHKGRIELEVTDTGIGMDEETRDRCLEPFFSMKGERGTGLGLAMVYGAVKRNGGRIEIDSAPGAGTTFRLILVAAPEAAAVAASDGEEDEVRPLRILLVDDDPYVLESTQSFLEGEGHSVLAADCGQMALAALSDGIDGKAFEVVVTDFGMPQMDGNAVARAVKSRVPDIPVIMMTGWGHRAPGKEQPHVDVTIGKPAEIDEIRAALRACEGLSAKVADVPGSG